MTKQQQYMLGGLALGVAWWLYRDYQKATAAPGEIGDAAIADDLTYNPAAVPASGTNGGLSFSAAFAAARKAGQKTFTWKGKLYTTDLRYGG